jgi:hypothetical protein
MTLAQLESDVDDQIKVEKLSAVNVRPATHMRHVYHVAIAAQDAGPFAGTSGAALPGGPPAPTPAQALAKLQMIRDRLAEGASFTDMARQYSDDIFSKASGGDLGIMHDGTQVNRDILAVALKMNKGDFSAPFKSFFGYELVYVESTQEDHPAAEDDLYAQADAEYRDSQTDGSIDQVLRSLEQNAKVSIYFRL